MDYLFSGAYNYYYLVLILQGYCVYHSYRRGTHSKWVWIIVFLPLIGCVVYIFQEIIKRRHISEITGRVGELVNPGGRISDLEKQLQFSNTFNNRVALADAYLEAGMNQKALDLYETSLQGLFENNEHVIKQLIYAYYALERYEDIVKIAPRVRNSVNFSKTRANLLYAFALEKTGNTTQPEIEYQAMNHRYANFEARYHYGLFLLKQQRREDAALVFYDMVEEGRHMSRREKGDGAAWIAKAEQEWKTIMKQ